MSIFFSVPTPDLFKIFIAALTMVQYHMGMPNRQHTGRD